MSQSGKIQKGGQKSQNSVAQLSFHVARVSLPVLFASETACQAQPLSQISETCNNLQDKFTAMVKTTKRNPSANYAMNEAFVETEQHADVRRTCLTSKELEFSSKTERGTTSIRQLEEHNQSKDMSVENGNGEALNSIFDIEAAPGHDAADKAKTTTKRKKVRQLLDWTSQISVNQTSSKHMTKICSATPRALRA